MAHKLELLEAELQAIILWDRLYTDNPSPDLIEKDACIARTFRRVQVVAELKRLALRTSGISPHTGTLNPLVDCLSSRNLLRYVTSCK